MKTISETVKISITHSVMNSVKGFVTDSVWRSVSCFIELPVQFSEGDSVLKSVGGPIRIFVFQKSKEFLNEKN